MSALSEAALDWDKVVVTLTDERQVPVENPRSNQALVSQSLLKNAASVATFVPLYSESQPIAEANAAVQNDVLPLDVCVLGMGDDLHTASLFPGTPGLADLLDPNGTDLVSAVTPPGADEPRVTLTAKALSSASHTYVLIKGKDKRAALDRALQTDDRPCRSNPRDPRYRAFPCRILRGLIPTPRRNTVTHPTVLDVTNALSSGVKKRGAIIWTVWAGHAITALRVRISGVPTSLTRLRACLPR